MATADDAVRARGSTILAEIKAAAARGQQAAAEEKNDGGETDERIDPLPRPGMSYVAHSRPWPRPQMTLFLVGHDYLPDGFAYADLRRCRMVPPREAGKGPELVLHFTFAEVTIEGRRLHSLCHLIGLHLIQWTWEHPSPEDFRDEQAILIRRLSVKALDG